MAVDQIQLIKRFDELPDDMLVGPKIAALLLNKSERDLRRNPPIPRVRLSERGCGYRVGNIRKLVRGEAS